MSKPTQTNPSLTPILNSHPPSYQSKYSVQNFLPQKNFFWLPIPNLLYSFYHLLLILTFMLLISLFPLPLIMNISSYFILTFLIIIIIINFCTALRWLHSKLNIKIMNKQICQRNLSKKPNKQAKGAFQFSRD